MQLQDTSWQQQKMPGVFVVPVVAKAHRDAAAVLQNSLPHLKELLHHQPSQVMAPLVCPNAGEGLFPHQLLDCIVKILAFCIAAGRAAPCLHVTEGRGLP